VNLFTKKIITLDAEVFGMDLSDLSIKVMQLEKDGKIDKVKGFACVEVPPGVFEDGKIINREKAIFFIKEVLKKAQPGKIKTNKVYCSLPESKVFLRLITVPELKEEEVAEAIKWEMEANIPLPIDQVYYDWQTFESTTKEQQDVLTVAAEKKVVDDIMETLKAAGLEVYGLEVESTASARSLIEQKEKEVPKNSLIVDLGSQRTSFIIVVNGITCFTSSIPFSSDGINDAITKILGIDVKEAEKIKLNQGIEVADVSNPIFKAIQYLLENLTGEIEKTLDFYGETFVGRQAIEKIILSGGGSNIKGLTGFLEKRLNKKVEMGNPWINLNIGKKGPIIDSVNSIRYSTVVGLALSGLHYEN